MEFIKIEGGSFIMGSPEGIGFPDDFEGPQQEVSVDDFQISTTTITNSDFKEFVEATGYLTEAERLGDSFVFHSLLDEETKKDNQQTHRTPWWLAVKGASWKHPFGPKSDINFLMDHPVVHVSRNDALAYCKWADCRLPTEIEWEYAAQGGAGNRLYPWGEEIGKDGKWEANIWQGDFPTDNSKEDGYLGTAPALCYEPNGYGLYQMIGNVWEWCHNPSRIPIDKLSEVSLDDHLYPSTQRYAIRGGSFLCHDSYCKRYRTSGRNGNDADSSASNMSFRCVKL